MESNSNPQPSASQPEEMKIENSRTVKVKTLSGQTYTLQVQPDIRISELKKEIQKHCDVPPERQRLIYLAKSLVDDQPLNSIINDDDQTIHLLAKVQQPEPQQTNPQPQTQQQSQPSTQNAEQNAGQNMGLNFGGLNLGSLISGFLNGSMGPGNVGPTTGPNSAGQQSTNPQGTGGPSPSMLGISINMNPSTDPSNPGQILQGQPQVRVISTAPLGTAGQNPFQQFFASQQSAPTQQQQQQNVGQQQQQQGVSQPSPRTLQGRPIELPHRNLFNMGQIVNSLMGPNANFPGPPMPPINVQRNSLVLLGSFLSSYQFQLTRLIPLISRLGDLMQRESLISNPNERHQVSLLAHAVGLAMEELASATTPVLPLIRNVQLGDRPGEFRMTERSQEQSQSQTQSQVQQPQPTIPQQNPQNTQPVGAFPFNLFGNNLQNLGQIFPGASQQQQAPTTQNTQNVQSQQQQQQVRREERTEIVDETRENNRESETRANPSQTRPATQPQAGIANLLSGGGGIGGILGQMGGMGPGLMTQTIASMLGEGREMISEEEEQLMLVLGPLTMGDLFGLFTAGNTACFDRIHPELKEGIKKLLEKHDGNLDSLAKSTAKTFAKIVEVSEENQSRVMEGFEPQTVAEEVSVKHVSRILETILKDYAPPQKFSDAFTQDFKLYIKEMLSEVSEGLYNGLDDLQVIIKAKILKQLASLEGSGLDGMEGLLMGLVWPQIWQKILKIYTEDQNSQANVPRVAEGGQEAEDELLKQIKESQNLKPDSENDDPPQLNFSEAYRKGDLNYEDKK